MQSHSNVSITLRDNIMGQALCIMSRLLSASHAGTTLGQLMYNVEIALSITRRDNSVGQLHV